MKKNKEKLVNDMWEAMLIPWINDPIPKVSADKIIPDITNPVKNIRRLLNKKIWKGGKNKC